MRAIIAGLGGRGRFWVDICRRNQDVELVAFAEPSEEARAAAKEQLGIPAEQMFTSLDDALAKVEADFVVDVTPPSAREAVARAALGAGLHVLAEKAMGEDWEMARRIAHLAGVSGKVYMVAQNYRFRHLPRTTRRLLAEGFLGRINTVAMGFYRPWGMGRHYVEIPFALLLEMTVHHFDTLRYLLGTEPEWVWAKTWNAPWGWHKGDVGHTVLFEFAGQVMVTHHALGCSVGKASPWDGELRIEGENGSLTWEDDGLYYTRSHPPEKARREKLELDDLPAADADAVLVEFLAAVRQNREPECSARDNLGTLAMVFAAIRSAQEGRQVAIAELTG
ncbi:MAG: Gfo/Idh/MocA family oxidoreductase [Armatimonadetes bacterium]|nr:Gfo/Idh/MocA family oxidoreductase [Armatimonadota bacterium]